MIKAIKIINLTCIFVLTAICTTACTNSSNGGISSYTSEILGRARNCENSDVKSLVVDIFKENNKYYKAINKSSISSISLMYPRAESYDREIDKYSCSGTIIMKSINSGFLPNKFDTSNFYYNKLNPGYFASETIDCNDTLSLEVEYESQISEGNVLVSSRFYDEKLSCSGYCPPITNLKYEQEQREEQERRQKEQARKIEIQKQIESEAENDIF